MGASILPSRACPMGTTKHTKATKRFFGFQKTSLFVFFVIFVVSALFAGAHDIPADVTVQAFVKPEGQRLRVLVRVPLGAMRDIDFPVHGPGFLNLNELDWYLAQGATLWIAESLAFDENGTPLGAPAV